ncbi:HoxN/HupN/NixA family nickel/cobalt transporter [Paenibacillus sp. FJAT-26967]|uniref:HoxN/HupN/NixA family nickel/cobalt transporter n=1 Tax=Paenibacillus sp. FJAT-26967 TaxID=1729690 RepID=UPI0008394B82|nr:HoxN/HupN/NixA family nickel/cobalt transporter [Paenibacillus sp. FJAT-26967]
MNYYRRNRKWLLYMIPVLILHVIGLLFLLIAADGRPSLWGLGLLAYTLGLRHAFDADHITVIDNTVRKLVQQKSNSAGVGFYFSLGHSSVVFVAVVIMVLSMHWMNTNLDVLQEVGGIFGPSISGLFLLFIGFLNLWVLLDLVRLFRRLHGSAYKEEESGELMYQRGLLSRWIRPLYKLVNRSWHIYPLGFLFGLGLDTASEILLLVVSGSAISGGVPAVGIFALPILFAAGMVLMDTADGIFMTSAYRWALNTPQRKLYYNIFVTGLGVTAAFIIGTVQLAQVFSTEMNWRGAIWMWFQAIDFGILGYALVALFLLSWAVSRGIWRRKKVKSSVI